MLWFNALSKEPVYKTIKKIVSELRTEDDFSADEAWKFATNKRKYLFDCILKTYEAPEPSDDEDKDTDE